MGKNMYVYDYDGHRVKVKKNRKKEKKEEEFTLPPVDGASPANNQGGNDLEPMSSRASTISSLPSGNTDNSLPPNIPLGASLSRRYTGFDGGDYLPLIRQKSSSIYSSRSEPAWYDKGRRLMYERNHKFDSSFIRSTRLRKEAPSDQLLTFYRSYDSPEPELRIMVSEQRFRNLNHLMDDITRLLDLREHERYVHTPAGYIIRHLGEFEDGGVFFFGPPRVCHPHEYSRFRHVATPDLLEADIATEERKKQKIRILSSTDRSQPPYVFLLDNTRHKSLHHVLQDINDLMMFDQGHVQRLCTMNGRTVQNVNELFFRPESVYIAVSWNSQAPFVNRGGLPYGATYTGDHRHPYSARSPYYGQYDVYDPLQLRPYEVLINNKKTILEPPHVDHFDGSLRKFDAPPFDKLDIEWVYGYNGKNCRNNLYVLPSEEALYFVAKIVVIYDVTMRHQRYYLGHTEEIRCITQHPSQWIFASGQVCGSGSGSGEMGHIHIWDAQSLKTLSVLDLEEVDLSVECMAFSQGDNGTKLASISTSGQDWTTHVWDWGQKRVLSKSDPYAEIELACMFDPLDHNRLVSCGKNHVYFWNVGNKVATYTDGEFVNHHVSEYVTCLGFNNKNELITADSNAFLHVWDPYKKRTTSIIKTTHTGSIITMIVLSDGYVITGGGSDRMLTLINYYQMIPTLHQTQIEKENGGIVAVVPLHNGYIGMELANMSLLIGTSSNNVMFGSIMGEFKAIVSGTSDQVKALAAHPIENSFLVAGMDCNTTMWSTNQHSPIWEMKLDEPCTAADFYPHGDLVAFGVTQGRCLVFGVTDSYQVANLQCVNDRSAVTCLSYSSNGSFLAIGTEAGGVHFFHCYDEGRNYRYISNIKSWAERIISIDWSVDETHLRFVTESFNFEVWDIERRCEERNRTTLRNLQYPKDTAPVGYYTAGAWSDADKDLVFTRSDKSLNNALYCAGTNQGSIRIYNYPCDGKIAPFNEVNVHSGNVSQVFFLPNERGVVSSGESDYCVVQWKFIHRDFTFEEAERHRFHGYYGYNRRPLLQEKRLSRYNPNVSLAR